MREREAGPAEIGARKRGEWAERRSASLTKIQKFLAGVYDAV